MTSFLSPTTVATLTRIVRDAHDTGLALDGGGVSLVLSRWDPDLEAWQALLPQTVRVIYPERQEQVIADESGEEIQVAGYFVKETPFDVEADDRFALGDVGDEEYGRVIRVFPAKLGKQRAAFTLSLGAE